MKNFVKPSVTIIGTGALGSTLGCFFRESEYRIRSLWNSKGGRILSDESAEVQKKSSSFPEHEEETGNLVYITTQDDLISEIAQSLSETSILWKGKTVVHCSGNFTSDELIVLSRKGATTASMHPIQTFNRGDGMSRLKNIYISLQGDGEATELLERIIYEMGAKPVLLDKKQKRILHIAAVMASNYLVALMYSTENLLKDAKLNDGLDMLQALIHQTTTNIFENGPEQALTGPISRGDIASVKMHLKELEGREQENLYRVLGLEALKIAGESGNLRQEQVDNLKRMLGGFAAEE